MASQVLACCCVVLTEEVDVADIGILKANGYYTVAVGLIF